MSKVPALSKVLTSRKAPELSKAHASNKHIVGIRPSYKSDSISFLHDRNSGVSAKASACIDTSCVGT